LIGNWRMGLRKIRKVKRKGGMEIRSGYKKREKKRSEKGGERRGKKGKREW
jgi:hypothetical protein